MCSSDLFARRLIGLARTRLDDRVRGKVDAEDVLQSVFRSFFVRQAKGQFDLDDWDGLWSLLARITLRTRGRQMGRFHAERREVGREVTPTASDGESRCEEEVAACDPHPTPQQAAILTETLEQVMRGLEDQQRQMVVLRLQGYTVPEISRQIGRTERTVHRVLSRVRDTLRRLEKE